MDTKKKQTQKSEARPIITDTCPYFEVELDKFDYYSESARLDTW